MKLNIFNTPTYLNKIILKDKEIQLTKLTYITGKNGSGKSTLLRYIKNKDLYKFDSLPISLIWENKVSNDRIIHFDTEMHNPKTSISEWKQTLMHITSQFRSHGENMLPLLLSITKFSNCLIMIDEPETGLSMNAILKVRSAFVKACKNNQLMVCTHHPLFLIHNSKYSSVYSLNEMDNINGRKYVKEYFKTLVD